jgi:hypothetical protein
VQGIQGSLARLGLPAVDLVQFYWHNYQIAKYVPTSLYLMEEVARGTVSHLGVTNFDTRRLQEMLNGGAEIISNQVLCPQPVLAAACSRSAADLWCTLSEPCAGFIPQSLSLRSAMLEGLLSFCCAQGRAWNHPCVCSRQGGCPLVCRFSTHCWIEGQKTA